MILCNRKLRRLDKIGIMKMGSEDHGTVVIVYVDLSTSHSVTERVRMKRIRNTHVGWT